jgi:hypothetical protein
MAVPPAALVVVNDHVAEDGDEPIELLATTLQEYVVLGKRFQDCPACGYRGPEPSEGAGMYP